MLEGLAGFGEGEYFVDDGLEFLLGDGVVHFLEGLAGADEYALDADVLHEYEGEVEWGLWACKDAYEADMAAHLAGADGLVEGADAADFDDVIYAESAGVLLDVT